MLIVSIPTFAGDYLTNTNQNAAFLRMIARGASIDIDGVYSNPAGLAFLPQNGLQVALTIQSAYQTRDIAATSPLWTMDGQTSVRNYEGKASAPVIPSVHAVYKNGDWAFSGSFAIVGGGGKASFDNGLPLPDLKHVLHWIRQYSDDTVSEIRETIEQHSECLSPSHHATSVPPS